MSKTVASTRPAELQLSALSLFHPVSVAEAELKSFFEQETHEVISSMNVVSTRRRVIIASSVLVASSQKHASNWRGWRNKNRNLYGNLDRKFAMSALLFKSKRQN